MGAKFSTNTVEQRAQDVLDRLRGASQFAQRGKCKKCGEDGHLTYQCRNTIHLRKTKEEISSTSSDDEEEVVFADPKLVCEQLENIINSTSSSDTETRKKKEIAQKMKLKNSKRKK